MNISSLNNTPVTPPFECHKTVDQSLFDQPIDRIQHRSAFHRVAHPPHNPILSPPELVHDSDEEEEDLLLSSPSMSLSSLMKQQGLIARSSSAPDEDNDEEEQEQATSRRRTWSMTNSSVGLERPCMRKRIKSNPMRSPSVIGDPLQSSAVDKSVVFQLHSPFPHPSSLCTSQVISGESLLSALRRRVTVARKQQSQKRRQQRLWSSIHLPHQPCREPTQIQIPKPRSFLLRKEEQQQQQQQYKQQKHQQQPLSDNESSPIISTISPSSPSLKVEPRPRLAPKPPDYIERKTSTSSAGRPSRVKGPCQACQETSDGCMRKAFNWPFPSSSIFNDKGKPFVYLCNKCGLRYNKSGGSVCRHCRWVFCKEEKRKAMQHIDQMRRSRPDGRVDPNELIENFVCTPKYWTCGRPWKVGWVLNGNDITLDEEETDDLYRSPSPH
ncbi:hypothetical protein EC973_001671 [Apophysomyces ossiformis]|uniref:GATA-type domain-containing protein n=1 Tax=Apophysomyces ossiformis TaxID=679940 RepID=A0A8H7ETY6_9FUNG|nr:hypothetical protein EC973_001671 [Apophysomyces ossiformis]